MQESSCNIIITNKIRSRGRSHCWLITKFNKYVAIEHKNWRSRSHRYGKHQLESSANTGSGENSYRHFLYIYQPAIHEAA
ncbi:MAG: hypothetical protein MUE44_19820 [Oscillatoriaceae cyanobacterium Prado104]|nr:hypothetical protein [Oscillatoriaceae cyanobacterium Prado104]